VIAATSVQEAGERRCSANAGGVTLKVVADVAERWRCCELVDFDARRFGRPCSVAPARLLLNCFCDDGADAAHWLVDLRDLPREAAVAVCVGFRNPICVVGAL
jgi:hypothetical protein